MTELTPKAQRDAHTEPRSRGERSDQLALIAFAEASAAAFVLYLVLGRDHWFFLDDWDFIVNRHVGSLGELFRPHNEHWSTLPIIVYRGLYQVFGTRTYLPSCDSEERLGVRVAACRRQPYTLKVWRSRSLIRRRHPICLRRRFQSHPSQSQPCSQPVASSTGRSAGWPQSRHGALTARTPVSAEDKSRPRRTARGQVSVGPWGRDTAISAREARALLPIPTM
jgi:hypothetical protein